jgi:hypothetical protein
VEEEAVWVSLPELPFELRGSWSTHLCDLGRIQAAGPWPVLQQLSS